MRDIVAETGLAACDLEECPCSSLQTSFSTNYDEGTFCFYAGERRKKAINTETI